MSYSSLRWPRWLEYVALSRDIRFALWAVVAGVIGSAFLSAPALAGGKAEPDSWTIKAQKIDPQRYFGMTVGNGMIGLLSSPKPFRTQQTVFGGAWEALGGDSAECIVRGFDLLNLGVTVDGARIERLEQLRNVSQTLNMKRAALVTRFDYGDKLTIEYTVRALRNRPYTVMAEVRFIAHRPADVAVESLISSEKSIEMPIVDDVKRFETRIRFRGTHTDTEVHPIVLAGASKKGPTGRLTIAAVTGFSFEDSSVAAPTISVTEGRAGFKRHLSAGEIYRFALVGSTLTSAHHTNPVGQAQRLTSAAIVDGPNKLIAAHEAAWDELWQSDIEIDGDAELQRDVRSMIYHLFSFVREGSRLSIPPMGLSLGAFGYCGHVFWDAEMWTFPALLALRPELARSMLDYRFDRLPAARRNATANGYRGAQFPWESATTGEEDIGPAALNAQIQIHVTADVGIAAWNYYRVTQDREWLRTTGFPLIRETADFWVSRVTRNGPRRYDIAGVTGSDEHAVNVTNDAFTNGAARSNLAAATDAAKVLDVPADPDWEHVRTNIPILRFSDGVTREHADYNGEFIQQADVNLLAFPLNEITDRHTIRLDLAYYAARLRADAPNMARSVLATQHQRLGETEQAYSLFMSGIAPYKRPPFGVLDETTNNDHPYFATGAGGLLQSLIYGFAGLHITDTGLVQKPTPLPRAWKSIRLKGIGPGRRGYVVR